MLAQKVIIIFQIGNDLEAEKWYKIITDNIFFKLLKEITITSIARGFHFSQSAFEFEFCHHSKFILCLQYIASSKPFLSWEEWQCVGSF